MKNREIEVSAKERRRDVLRNLKRFGGKLYKKMEKGVFPRVRIKAPSDPVKPER